MANPARFIFGASEGISGDVPPQDPFAPRELTQEDYDRLQQLAEGGVEAEWVDVPTAALIMSVSKWTVYRAIDKGVIPCVRIGRSIRINRKLLDRTLMSLSEGGEPA